MEPYDDHSEQAARQILLEYFKDKPAGDFRSALTSFVLPVYRFLFVKKAQQRDSGKSLIVGLSAPQGFGKTTAGEVLELLFRHHGWAFLSVSLDDFYYPSAYLAQLAKQTKNRLLRGRGLPGTHDVGLAVSVLERFRADRWPDGGLQLPVYDKGALEGQGDRAPEAEWKRVEKRPDIVLLDGWCLGFLPKEDETELSVEMAEINRSLEDYRALRCLVDVWIIVGAEDVKTCVYEWREEQEDWLLHSKGKGMDALQLKAFIDKFIPVYSIYQPRLEDHCRQLAGETNLEESSGLYFQVDRRRNTIASKLFGTSFENRAGN